MLINENLLRSRINLEHSQYNSRETKIQSENRTLYKASNNYDIFLSHSYYDKELIYSLVELFNNAGYCVYVDWMIDTELDRSMVNAQTASQLRFRMCECKGLAYISTTNISDSKWCPWELGYVDGKKNGRCAILPIVKSDKDCFKGQEYLGLYPYIDYASSKNSNKYDFWVNDPNDDQKYVCLRDWLNGKDLHSHNV